MLDIVDHSRLHQHWVLTDDRVIKYVRPADFFNHSQLRWVRLDWPLLTALIDRWRIETNMFHLRHGEMTVTLQDVALPLGLRVDGPAVTGTDDGLGHGV